MKRGILGALAAMVLVVMGAVVAQADPFSSPRQAAGDQYGVTGTVGATVTQSSITPTTPAATTPGTGTTPVTSTTDGEPVTSADDPGRTTTSPSGSGSAQSSGGGSSQGAPAPAEGSAAERLRISLVTFGASSDAGTQEREVRREVQDAVRQAGLELVLKGRLTESRLARAMGSDLVEAMFPGGATPEALARALASALPAPSAQSRRLTEMLFGTAFDEPVTYIVFTRTQALDGDLRGFQDGLAKAVVGSPMVPAYAELSDARRSFVGAFTALGVPTVDNVDQPTGKGALVDILLNGAKGDFGIKKTASSGEGPTITAARTAFAGPAAESDGGPGTLVVLLVGALAAGAGLAVARRVRRSTTG